MQTVWYLVKLFMSLGLGVVVAKVIGKEHFKFATGKALDGVLYLLLFLMGVNTARIPDIISQIMQIGLDALLATILVTIGCIITAALLSLAMHKRSSATERVRQRITWERLKTPAVMIGNVIAGFLCAYLTNYFNWFDDSMITVVLYLMLFLVGMQMVQNGVNLLPLLKSPLMVLLPLSTLIGTYLGALALPLCSAYSIRESLTLVSGFGWYSLSGVLISSLGNPHLGAVSFLSNLFRETIAFVLIPLLATFSHFSYSSVSIAGATSMDVTLPLLKKSLGDTIVPLAIAHGVIMTFAAPFLIPLCYGSGL